MTSIAVIHLVWGPLSTGPLRRFVASYRRCTSGEPHELVVLLNGFETPDARGLLLAELTGVDHRLIEFDRPMLDLRAYGLAAASLEHNRLCFLNSHSELLADGWLALLAEAEVQADVGLAGATGSFESHADAARGPARRRLVNHLALWRLRRDFPPFPNPHIRTNGLFMAAELARSLGLEGAVDKASAYRLESGRIGITSQVERRGLRSVVVGRDGRSFTPPLWPASGTFRSANQDNLLVADNQTRHYRDAPPAERRELQESTWGRPR